MSGPTEVGGQGQLPTSQIVLDEREGVNQVGHRKDEGVFLTGGLTHDYFTNTDSATGTQFGVGWRPREVPVTVRALVSVFGKSSMQEAYGTIAADTTIDVLFDEENPRDQLAFGARMIGPLFGKGKESEGAMVLMKTRLPVGSIDSRLGVVIEAGAGSTFDGNPLVMTSVLLEATL